MIGKMSQTCKEPSTGDIVKCDMCEELFTLDEENPHAGQCDVGVFCEECWTRACEEKGEIYEKWWKKFKGEVAGVRGGGYWWWHIKE